MKLKSYSRLNTSDYPEDQQPIVEKMGGQVNSAFDPVYSALSNRLTFEDNFLCTVKDVEVSVGANGVPLTRTSFSLNNNLPVTGVIILNVTNKTTAGAFPTAAPFMSFSQNGTVLYIDHMFGLVPSARYVIRVLALN
jgi:hypothetical protein